MQVILTDIQSGDYDAARANMDAPANTTSDAELAAFSAAYTTDLGGYVSMPSGFGELISGYMALSSQFKAYKGRPGAVPMPAKFDSGWVLVVYVAGTSGQGPTGSNGMPLPQELILVGADGTEYAIPPSTGGGALPGASTPGADTDTDTGEDLPEADGDEEPEEGP